MIEIIISVNDENDGWSLTGSNHGLSETRISGYQNTIATDKKTLYCGFCTHQIIFFSNL